MALSPLQFDLNDVRVRVRREPRNHGKPATDPQFPKMAVCEFAVVVDSREQLPYEFSGMTGTAGEALVVPTVVAGLKSGDYSVRGFEDTIAVERKSLDDLFGSVTWGRDRFEREVARLNALPGFAAVVIEGTWPEIMAPAEHRPGWINQTEPQSVVGTIVAWSLRYPRVHWWACGGRREAERLTFAILRKFWMEQQ